MTARQNSKRQEENKNNTTVEGRQNATARQTQQEQKDTDASRQEK